MTSIEQFFDKIPTEKDLARLPDKEFRGAVDPWTLRLRKKMGLPLKIVAEKLKRSPKNKK